MAAVPYLLTVTDRSSASSDLLITATVAQVLCNAIDSMASEWTCTGTSSLSAVVIAPSVPGSDALAVLEHLYAHWIAFVCSGHFEVSSHYYLAGIQAGTVRITIDILDFGNVVIICFCIGVGDRGEGAVFRSCHIVLRSPKP